MALVDGTIRTEEVIVLIAIHIPYIYSCNSQTLVTCTVRCSNTWPPDYKTVFMKFKLLMNIKIAKIKVIFRFKSPKPVIYPANKC